MNLQLSEDQILIQRSVQDYFARAHDFDGYLKALEGGQPSGTPAWHDMTEMGWLGMLVPEDAGGMGFGPQEAMLVMEGVGNALLLEPLLPTSVLCAPLLARSGATDLAATVLDSCLQGREVLTLAWEETSTSWQDPWRIDARVSGDGPAVSLTGRKRLAAHGSLATWLLVSARDPQGSPSLWLVDRKNAGVAVTPVRMVDGSHAADIEFEQVRLAAGNLIATGHAAELALRSSLFRGLAATCAVALGAMEAVLRITRQYLHERRQFGRPLADFQALQHRFADMSIAAERARSMTCLAAIRADAAAAGDVSAQRDLSMAKFVVGESSRLVGGQGIQLHGGMGMAYEYPVGHYYRRMLALEPCFGSSNEHLVFLSDTLLAH